MEAAFYLLVLIAASAGILKTADWFVDGTVDIAAALRLPKVFIGLTLVSLVTTAPEWIVTVSASHAGEAGMAVGNSVGTFIANIGLVFAVGTLVHEIRAQKGDFRYRIGFLLGSLAVMYLLCWDGMLDRADAGILLLLLVLFFVFNYVLALRERRKISLEVDTGNKKTLLKKGAFLFALGGAGTLLLARFGLLGPGLKLAEIFCVPPILIGLTVIAVSTSVPELFTAIFSGRKGEGEIAFGNVVGANVLNLLWVLGAGAMVNPLPISPLTLKVHFPVAGGFALLLLILGLRARRYAKKEGGLILSLYAVYVFALFFVIYAQKGSVLP